MDISFKDIEKRNNIIIGLLKNMLTKNKTFGLEGFRNGHSDHQYLVRLDTSGFQEDLITKAMIELNSKSNIITLNDITYSSPIGSINFCPSENYVEFQVPKDILHILRTEVLQKNKSK